MENRTVITPMFIYKVFSFLFCAGIAFLLYLWLGGPNMSEKQSQDSNLARILLLLGLFSGFSLLNFVSFFFDFRKIIIDRKGLSSVGIFENKHFVWEDIVDINNLLWGVIITTKSDKFTVSRWGMNKNEIWNAIDFYRNGPGARRTVNSGGRIF